MWQLSLVQSIRSLAAGGPIFAQLGLVSPRVSSTAVVIVEPIHQFRLALALEGAGWSRSSSRHTRGILPPGFIRLVHPGLVCPLDIYGIFPGFYAVPAAVFAERWSRRMTLPVGGIGVPTLDRVSTMLVAGHNKLGTLARDRRAESHIDYFVAMFRNSLTPAEQESVVNLVDAVGGSGPLRPFLSAIGVEVGGIALPSEVYCQVRLALNRFRDSIFFAVLLFEAPPGRRMVGFLSIPRSHPKRVLRALLAAPRSFVVVAGSRARYRKQLTGALRE